MMIQDLDTLRAELNELSHQAVEAANYLSTKEDMEAALQTLGRNLRKLARRLGLREEDLTTISIFAKL